MSVRRSLFVLTLIILGLPVAFFSSRAQQVQQQNEAGSSLQLYTIDEGDVRLTVSTVGRIAADETASLSFTSPGRVEEVLVEVGDYVLAGDSLVTQSATAQQIAYQQAELSLQAAELRLQDVLDGPGEDQIRIAEANVNAAWGAYNAIASGVSEEDILAAELRYEQARESVIAANRARRVANSPSNEVIELLDAEIGEATFNAEIARLQLEQLRNGNQGQLNAAYARVAQTQAELEWVRAGATETEIRTAEVAVDQARVNLEQAARDLSRATLIAPFDGVISAVSVEMGALVTPGMMVVEITDLEPLNLSVGVDEIDIRRIREDMLASIRVDALGNTSFPAELRSIGVIGTTRDGVITYDVEIALSEVDPRVRVGMTAEADIVVDEQENVLIVPNEYVRLDRRANKAYVNVLRPDGTLEEVEIVLGLQGADNSEVVSGLAKGDVVAVDLAGGRFSLFGE